MEAQFIADNVRRWRLDRGLSQEKLAVQAQLSRQAYRNIENGISVPRVSTLENIATALNVSLRDLVKPVSELHGVRFRAQKLMTRRGNILAEVSVLLEDHNALEQITGETSQYGLADLAGALHELKPGRERALHAAEQARQHLGLTQDEPIRDLCGLVEQTGIKLLLVNLASDGFFGLSVAEQSGGPAIVVNVWERISVERWIFTTAHEMGHLLLHLDGYNVNETEQNRMEEDEANMFASHFLMPEPIFTREWNNTRGLPLVDRVLKVKRMFHVSYAAVLVRLTENGTYDNNIWPKFLGEYRRRTRRTLRKSDEPDGLSAEFFIESTALAAQEPESLSHADFIPQRKYALVRLAVERGLITLGRAAELLRVSMSEMRQMAATWEA